MTTQTFQTKAGKNTFDVYEVDGAICAFEVEDVTFTPDDGAFIHMLEAENRRLKKNAEESADIIFELQKSIVNLDKALEDSRVQEKATKVAEPEPEAVKLPKRSSPKYKAMKVWCREKYDADWWKTDKEARLREAMVAV